MEADNSRHHRLDYPRTVSVAASEDDRATIGGILAVDDSPLTLNKIVLALADSGQPVHSATNVRDAMKLYVEQRPWVIVSDMEMPGGGGVDLCAQIRCQSTGQPVHFIMLTVHSDEASLLEAYNAGVDDFVPKPFRPAELLARVRAGMRTCQLREELVRKSAGLEAMNNQLAVMNGRLDRLSITDELTGLFNRRHAMVRLEEQWSLAERYERAMSIAMIDIDHFKRINDTHGHDAGDAVLSQLSSVLRQSTRGSDTVCRVGGEEFLIILPSQTEEEATACAERCRRVVEQNTFTAADVSISATISVGVATRTAAIAQFPDLLRAADRALYCAKNGGRNQVCVFESPKESIRVTVPPSRDF